MLTGDAIESSVGGRDGFFMAEAIRLREDQDGRLVEVLRQRRCRGFVDMLSVIDAVQAVSDEATKAQDEDGYGQCEPFEEASHQMIDYFITLVPVAIRM